MASTEKRTCAGLNLLKNRDNSLTISGTELDAVSALALGRAISSQPPFFCITTTSRNRDEFDLYRGHKARVMLAMVQEINNDYIGRLDLPAPKPTPPPPNKPPTAPSYQPQ